ncbi:MAG: dihydroorotate dehydrogenase [Actinomycetota bacterium]|nr:dihydroorotate dehydrogenase [Actinomycetota bacterium]
MNLDVILGPLHLRSPLIAASGTVGSVVDFADSVDFALYGAAVAKSVSPEPWEGRPAPRLAPAGAGMLNGIGIQNPGVEAWKAQYASKLAALPVPVWGSVVAHDIEGFATVAAAMATAGVVAIEVNLSCPNLDGLPFALDPSLSASVVASVREATDLPIGAKLSPDAQPIAAVADAVAGAGADWVVLTNTAMGARIDTTTRRPLLSGTIGGYSGEALRPIALRCVLEVARDVPDIPIVGCGGVSTSADAVEFLLAGATCVAIGTAHFGAPRVAGRIAKGLHTYGRAHGVERASELIGAYEPW